MEVQRHHILYERNTWDSTPQTKRLRQIPSLIVPMHAEVEDALHRNISHIPPLDRHTASHTLQAFKSESTHLKSIYRLMEAIEIATEHPRATYLEKRLGELTVYAISLQIPFIRAGQLTNEVGGYVN